MTSKKGFSLLEVIFALGILVGVMSLLFTSFGGNARRVKKARLQTQVVYLLQKKMTEIEVMYENRPQELPEDTQAGDFGKDYKGYSFQWEAKKFEMPDLSAVLTTRGEGTDEVSLLVMSKMKEFLEDSVKEVKLTVAYKPRVKSAERKFSISSLIVDFEAGLELGIDASLLQSLGGGSSGP